MDKKNSKPKTYRELRKIWEKGLAEGKCPACLSIITEHMQVWDRGRDGFECTICR